MCSFREVKALFVSQSTAALEWAQSSCKLINAEFTSPSGTDWLLIQPLLSHSWREHFYPEISNYVAHMQVVNVLLQFF